MTGNGVRKLKVSRDTVLFVVGLAGIIYETVVTGGDRPTLLVMFGAMVGLPAFLRSDEDKKKSSETPAPTVQPAQPAPTAEAQPAPTAEAQPAEKLKQEVQPSSIPPNIQIGDS